MKLQHNHIHLNLNPILRKIIITKIQKIDKNKNKNTMLFHLKLKIYSNILIYIIYSVTSVIYHR